MDAVIFDLDGVLVDSEPTHARAIDQVCARHGVPTDGLEHIGLPDRVVLQRAWSAAGRTLQESLLAELLEEKGRQFREMVRAGKALPYPSAIDVIRELSARFRIGICSAAMRADVIALLEQIELRELPQVIISEEDSAEPKPSPAPYRAAAQALGVSPQRCIAVEDSPTGIESARAAGCHVVALLHTLDAEDLRCAHVVLPEIGQLRAHVLGGIDADR